MGMGLQLPLTGEQWGLNQEEGVRGYTRHQRSNTEPGKLTPGEHRPEAPGDPSTGDLAVDGLLPPTWH